MIQINVHWSSYHDFNTKIYLQFEHFVCDTFKLNTGTFLANSPVRRKKTNVQSPVGLVEAELDINNWSIVSSNIIS